MKQEIQFKRTRNLGELIQGSFAFARQEFKPLFTLLLMYAGPFVLMYAIAAAYYQNDMQQLTTDPTAFTQTYMNDPISMLKTFAKPLLSMMLFGMVSMVMITAITFSYIKTYIELGHNNFTTDDVWSTAKQHIGPFFGYSLAYGAIVSIGMFLFIIPGMYWYVAFSLLFVVRIMENKSLGESLGRSQHLIKDNWWSTFGFYLVMSIIIGAISSVFGIAQGIITGIQAATGGSDVLQFVHIAVGAVVAFLSYLFYVLLYIGQALLYFSLVEGKESPELENRINQI